MRVEQQCWNAKDGWRLNAGVPCRDAQLVLAFGAPVRIRDAARWADLRARWPRACIVACSTAGEIAQTSVRDDSLVATALEFERSHVRSASVRLSEVPDSATAGSELGRKLDPQGLRHVFVLSDGLRVNGSELVRGISAVLPGDVAVTGGLAGDGSRFEQTAVAIDDVPDTARGVAGCMASD